MEQEHNDNTITITTTTTTKTTTTMDREWGSLTVAEVIRANRKKTLCGVVRNM